MAEIKHTESTLRTINRAVEYCKLHRHEFVMPEHLLYALIDDDNFHNAFNIFYDIDKLRTRIDDLFRKIDCVPDDVDYEPDFSAQMNEVLQRASLQVASSSADAIDIPHLVSGLLELDESWASYLMNDALYDKQANFMSRLIEFCEFEQSLYEVSNNMQHDDIFGFSEEDDWKSLVTCMNDHYSERNPLIGRERELTRTIQVLCRRDKNNPLHVGEPGVGKTAIVWGLARQIEEGRVPERLRGSHIYKLDIGTLLAGTQYRGDFEKRLKMILEGITKECANNIIYIDEIHTLVGAGATGEGAMDASNMLKPYLEAGNIRFIGSTTYEEYNRHFARSKGLVRRFQQIDIAEPSVEETKEIIRQLKPHYEEYHTVSYDDEAIEFAVEASDRHIHDRYLPDKAIDLIDEAGAAMELAGTGTTIGKKEIADVLSRICKVDALAEAANDDYQQLEHLADRMLSQIYGQDEAIRNVVESVQMSRAGLLDDNKPLASLLFVGPTGVGKTEVAKVLSKELGISLVRFDMSEYTEKHAVAKLIGSPAGYVGYEDGGLLTDAIRKSPNCVLLLDEIEKAHPDIYNIMLQVMDYGRLTDNKGQHADFRNVVLIMTSNAGAQHASSVGFNSRISRGDAMMKQVKKTFKPEFINRLSAAVVFHDMDRHMATQILQKKLRELEMRLEAKKVKMTLNDDAFTYILNEGFTAEYGAREIDRVISQQLKPLLMREILFGSLKKGGEIKIGMKDGGISVE